MQNEIDNYLGKAKAQINGQLSGLASHTPALVELIYLVKDQQNRIERLEAALATK